MVIYEFRYNPKTSEKLIDESEVMKDQALFSEEKAYNYPREIYPNNRASQSMDSWTQNQDNFDEFLKGSSQSFLNNDYSFKESESGVNIDNIHAEISCDNPLDTDSNADSKQLELEDLEVKKSLRDKFNEEFEEEKVL